MDAPQSIKKKAGSLVFDMGNGISLIVNNDLNIDENAHLLDKTPVETACRLRAAAVFLDASDSANAKRLRDAADFLEDHAKDRIYVEVD